MMIGSIDFKRMLEDKERTLKELKEMHVKRQQLKDKNVIEHYLFSNDEIVPLGQGSSIKADFFLNLKQLSETDNLFVYLNSILNKKSENFPIFSSNVYGDLSEYKKIKKQYKLDFVINSEFFVDDIYTKNMEELLKNFYNQPNKQLCHDESSNHPRYSKGIRESIPSISIYLHFLLLSIYANKANELFEETGNLINSFDIKISDKSYYGYLDFEIEYEIILLNEEAFTNRKSVLIGNLDKDITINVFRWEEEQLLSFKIDVNIDVLKEIAGETKIHIFRSLVDYEVLSLIKSEEIFNDFCYHYYHDAEHRSFIHMLKRNRKELFDFIRNVEKEQVIETKKLFKKKVHVERKGMQVIASEKINKFLKTYKNNKYYQPYLNELDKMINQLNLIVKINHVLGHYIYYKFILFVEKFEELIEINELKNYIYYLDICKKEINESYEFFTNVLIKDKKDMSETPMNDDKFNQEQLKIQELKNIF